MKLSTLARQFARPIFASVVALGVSAPALSADLTVTVPAVASNDGEVMVALYDSAETFNKETQSALRSQATSGVMTFTFNDVPVGGYAVMLFHDVNGNGKLDRNLLGIPKEPWGASLQGKRVFGPPKWKDVRFAMSPTDMALIVKLK